MGPLKNIGAQFAWVFMFAKGNFQHDMAQQGQALDQIAQLVDQGHVQSTLRQTYHGLTVANVTKAFEAVKSHQAIGKVVITHE
jgi:NADPH:quinone reductase-like Zn-dependent oxidoreductase